jgi:hypothetical protein
VAAGRESQDELPGVADQAGGYTDQAVVQGGDHGLAAADTVAAQRPLGL